MPVVHNGVGPATFPPTSFMIIIVLKFRAIERIASPHHRCGDDDKRERAIKGAER